MTAFKYIRLGVALSQIENRLANIHTVDIVKAVCKYYNLQFDQMTGPYKTRRIGYARNIAAYVLKQHTGLTYECIGNLFGITREAAYRACATIRGNKDPRILEEVADVQDMVKSLILAEYNEEIPF